MTWKHIRKLTEPTVHVAAGTGTLVGGEMAELMSDLDEFDWPDMELLRADVQTCAFITESS